VKLNLSQSSEMQIRIVCRVLATLLICLHWRMCHQHSCIMVKICSISVAMSPVSHSSTVGPYSWSSIQTVTMENTPVFISRLPTHAEMWGL